MGISPKWSACRASESARRIIRCWVPIAPHLARLREYSTRCESARPGAPSTGSFADIVPSATSDDQLSRWVDALKARHLESLTFTELRKSVVALSRIYVQARARLDSGGALDGAGKRAAFACFYAPLHFLTVREVVNRLEADAAVSKRIVDLGCGLAAAGAAWATLCARQPPVIGCDVSSWAVSEARHTLRHFGLRGKILRRAIAAAPSVRGGDGVVAAFAVNELSQGERSALLGRLLDAHGHGASVLVIEPISRQIAPWWDEWREAASSTGGRDDEWRLAVSLPPFLAELDRASGLDHSELTARSLFWGQS